MYPLDDTIVAIASPSGGAARGIVRVSGPNAVDAVGMLFTAANSASLDASHAAYTVSGSLSLPGLSSPLPCEAFVWAACDAKQPTPRVRSYTGQPVVEIHTLGSPPLLQAVLKALCVRGVRLAGPGEFTLRAFLAGRLDLTQAEAVLGVIDAEDTHSLGVALEQLAGGLARPLHQMRDKLLELLSHLEAGFDFAEEDLAFITQDELEHRLLDAQRGINGMLQQMRARGEVSEVFRAVLVGRPNTGKSSLFNALCGDRAAIVSEHPGTTRDYLAARLDLDGVPCELIDTAGTSDACEELNEIERMAESMTHRQRRQADIELLCIDAARPVEFENTETERPRIVVLTKCDTVQDLPDDASAVVTSSRKGLGIAELRERLRQQMLAMRGHRSDVVACTAVRCEETLRMAGDALQQALVVTRSGQEELVASEIRAALDELGKVVGAVFTEDVLDRIFSRFCIGK